MSFGPVMVLDAVNTRRTRGATMVLHDVSAERLEVAVRFANRINERRGNPITVEASTDPAEALPGADFCLTSAEVGPVAPLGRGLRDPPAVRGHPDHR